MIDELNLQERWHSASSPRCMPVVDVLVLGRSAPLIPGCEFSVATACLLLHFVWFQPSRAALSAECSL